MTALEASGLSKRFGGVAAVNDVSFEVPQATVYSIIGPNGAGKTTLFNLVSGIYPPDGGTVRLAGRDVTGRPAHVLARAGLGRTFQTPQIFAGMTALENVMTGAHRHCDGRLFAAVTRWGRLDAAERERRAQALALLEKLGLAAAADSDAAALPYGALKRLEIARALAGRPAILMLDEPAAGLNHREAHDILLLLRRIAGGGVTVVMIEHNMRLVMGVSDRILVLASGAVLAEGAPDEIRANPAVVDAYLGAAVDMEPRHA